MFKFDLRSIHDWRDSEPVVTIPSMYDWRDSERFEKSGCCQPRLTYPSSRGFHKTPFSLVSKTYWCGIVTMANPAWDPWRRWIDQCVPDYIAMWQSGRYGFWDGRLVPRGDDPEGVLDFQRDRTTDDTMSTVPPHDNLEVDCCGSYGCPCQFVGMTQVCNQLSDNGDIHIQFHSDFKDTRSPAIRLAVNGRAVIHRSQVSFLLWFGREYAGPLSTIKSLFVYSVGSTAAGFQATPHEGPHLDVITTVLECLGWRSGLKLSRFSLKLNMAGGGADSFLHASELDVEKFVAVFQRHTERLTFFRFMANVQEVGELSTFTFGPLFEVVTSQWCPSTFGDSVHMEIVSSNIWRYTSITAIRDLCGFDWGQFPLRIDCRNDEGCLHRFVNGVCCNKGMGHGNLMLKYSRDSIAVLRLFKENRVFAKITYVYTGSRELEPNAWELLKYWRAVFEGSTPFVCLDMQPKKELLTPEFISAANFLIDKRLSGNHFLLRFRPFADCLPGMNSEAKERLLHRMRFFVELNNARRYRMTYGSNGFRQVDLVRVLCDLNENGSGLDSTFGVVVSTPDLLPR